MIDSDGSSIFGKTTIMNEMNLKGLYDGNFYHVCTDGLEQVTLLKNKYGLKKVLHRTDDCISLIDTETSVLQ